jgi:hypothetical protein
MKKALLIISCFTFLYACKPAVKGNVWTEAYEQNWRYQFDRDMKARLPDDAKRANLVNFMLIRLKAELPNGIESVPADSLNRLSIKIGAEYGYAHEKEAVASATGMVPTLRPWTKEIERGLREAVLSGSKPEELKENTILCDCYITELKKAYTDSVMLPVPHDTIQKVAKICYDKLKLKK